MTDFLWFLCLWLCGWACLPFSCRIWRDSLPDGGLAAGRVLLLAVWTVAAFWLGTLGVSARITALLIFPLLTSGLFLLWRERVQLAMRLKRQRLALGASELIFLLSFIFFLTLRAFGPETADGEKPMDLALMASCARAESLPPPNPYVAGERVTAYYYLGHLQAALLTNAVRSSPQWTYNLMCATIPALVFSSLFSVCAALCRSVKWGACATGGVLCLGTLAPLRHIWPHIFGEVPIGPAYFSTSRVIPFTINEYPFFTFAFGDLHAHLLAMPLIALVFCLSWALWCEGRSAPLLPLSLALGALAMTNTWDLPLYALLGGMAVWHGRKSPREKIAGVAMVFALAVFVASGFLLGLKTASSGVHFLWPSSPVIPWLMVWGVFLGALSFGFIYHRRSRETGFCGALAGCGALALLASEFTWMGYLAPPYHRQDTVFKFGMQAWYFWGVASSCLVLPQIAARRWPRWLPFAFLPFLAVMLFSSVSVAWGRTEGFRQWKGLNAWSQLAPAPQQAAQWLHTRARGSERIFLIEAEQYEGGDYTEYSRYANATGIPIVIGPRAHSFQWRGGGWEEVFQRKRDVRTFYTTADQTTRLAILRKYAVRWIICGELERREYGAESIARVEDAFPTAAAFGAGVDRVAILESLQP